MQKSFEIKISEDNSYFERRAAGPLFMKLAFLETIYLIVEYCNGDGYHDGAIMGWTQSASDPLR